MWRLRHIFLASFRCPELSSLHLPIQNPPISEDGTADIQYKSQINKHTTKKTASCTHIGHICVSVRKSFLLRYAHILHSLILFSTLIRGTALVKAVLRAASRLHDELLRGVLNAPLLFFERASEGQILQRFTRDQDELDTKLPFMVEMAIQSVYFLLASVAAAVYIYPALLGILAVLLIIFVLAYIGFISVAHMLKRLECVSRTPWLALSADTGAGVSVIRAFNKQSMFLKRFYVLLDRYAVPSYLYSCALRWLSFRMELLAAVGVTVTALMCVTSESRGAAESGLALIFIVQLSGLLQYSLRMLVETESRFYSVERVLSYGRNLPHEDDLLRPRVQSDEKNNSVRKRRASSKAVEIPKNWPSRGFVEFRNVSMSYSANGPLALNNVSLKIPEGTRFGIVGRTGSGKSSLVAALAQLYPIQQGFISIDGKDLMDICVEGVRQSLAVLPQKPAVFAGSLRHNLAPLGSSSDVELIQALGACSLGSRWSGGLDDENTISSAGSNLSGGEKQLLCLARALLSGAKIVVLDEATAELDEATEERIMTTICKVFGQVTLINVAHRPRTVKTCQYIAVMHKGQVVECDTYSSLMSNPDSRLHHLAL